MGRYCLFTRWVFFAAILASIAAGATDSVVSRTPFGQPNIQGTWSAVSLTPLERPPQVPALNLTEAQAQTMVQMVLKFMPDNIDPQFGWENPRHLNKVGDNYRSSVVIKPENGLIPFSDKGLKWVAWSKYRDENLFSHPEQLQKFDRCLSGFGMPPIRMFPIHIPHYIVQTPEHVLIYTEDPSGARIIALKETANPDSLRTWHGHSVGRWQGNTLTVETTHFRADSPERFVLGRVVLIGANGKVTERFTPTSPREILYQFTVEDPDYYTQAWSGEMTFTRTDVPIFEYSCHEGNLALEGMMRGNQLQQAQRRQQGIAVPPEPLRD